MLKIYGFQTCLFKFKHKGIGPKITYCFHLTKSSYTQSITEICFSTAGHSCYDKVLPFINPMAFRQLQDGSSIQLSCRIVYRFIDISRWIAESCKLQQTVEFFVISYLPFPFNDFCKAFFKACKVSIWIVQLLLRNLWGLTP